MSLMGFDVYNDAAWCITKEGEKTYEYGWLDKVMRVAEDGKELARFEYHNNNQLAKVVRENGVETFEWDGLALIERSGTKYINEPHPGGGNPVLVIDGESTEAIFTDMLGTSLGKVEKNGYSAITKTSFGAESNNANSFFTGKPYVENLGYAFLFRNYRADMGKWQTQDLIGYSDGWNNFAYCNNMITNSLDSLGSYVITSATLSNMSPTDGSEIIYTSTPNSHLYVSISGTASFTVSKEATDGPNVPVVVIAQFDKSSFYIDLNKTFSPNQFGEMTITYNFRNITYPYLGTGADSGMHWYRFGVAIAKTPNNYTSYILSEKQYFTLKERENE